MRAKRSFLLWMILCLGLALCGCRERVGSGGQGSALFPGASGRVDEARQGEGPSGALAADAALKEENPAEEGEAGGQTRENPEATRKEYDENAQAEIAPDTGRLLHGEGEGSGLPRDGEEASPLVNRLNGQAKETALQTVAAEAAERMGVSREAEAADSALTYYTVLLRERMDSLFECQRLSVYWETPQSRVTIHKTSPEHRLITDAGLYDVSSRLLPENLLVDDGWVARKNPGVIVKMVDGSVLGSGTQGTGAARAVYEGLRAREGYLSIDAVKNGRVLLLSQEMLSAPYLQTAAMVLIARTASPALFEDVDADAMLDMLMEEATGTPSAGTYYYAPSI